MRAVRDNALSQLFGVLFLVSVAGQSVAGWKVFNEEAATHDEAGLGYLSYLASSHFGQALLENWQSEYLQFSLFILATVYLVQRGSNESKRPGQEGRESDAEQQLGPYAKADSPRWARAGGLRRSLYSHSLLIVMTAIFVGSWFGQSVTGHGAYNEEQRAHDAAPISWSAYVRHPDFWEATLQNWQSEFLAIGTMAVFTIYLRERGSPESKPVGAPHTESGTSG